VRLVVVVAVVAITVTDAFVGVFFNNTVFSVYHIRMVDVVLSSCTRNYYINVLLPTDAGITSPVSFNTRILCPLEHLEGIVSPTFPDLIFTY
jgi:hypothetical protein